MEITNEPENTEVRFVVMPDGYADMTFISRSIAAALEYYRVGTKENTGYSPEEIAVGTAISNCAMQAFALECAIKAVYQALNKNFAKRHDLYLLYTNLPSSAQQEIEANWKKWTIAPETTEMTFREFVQDHKDDFEDWRYLQGQQMTSAYLAFFVGTQAVNHVADTLRGAQQS